MPKAVYIEPPVITVLEGDCRDILPTLDVKSFSACITDPPYGIALAAHSAETCMDGTPRRRQRPTKINNDECLTVATYVARWADDNELPVCMFCSPYRQLPGTWRNWLVWDKGEAVGGGGDPKTCWKRTFEMIGIRNNRPLREGRDGAVLRVPINTRHDFEYHPCQKPVALLRYLIRQLTPPGGTVLDPFAGSGTTGVAAKLEGRGCVMIEQDPEHAATARRRTAECRV